MASNKAEGTQISVLGTTHELTDITDAANYVPYIDLFNLVLGDILELYASVKNISTGTIRRTLLGTFGFNNTAHAPLVFPVPLSVVEQVTYELNQKVGTMSITSMTGTVAVRDTVTGATSGATGVVEFMDSAGSPTEIRMRVTSDGTAFQDSENAEIDGSNFLVLNDATPAQSYDWAVVDPLGT